MSPIRANLPAREREPAAARRHGREHGFADAELDWQQSPRMLAQRQVIETVFGDRARLSPASNRPVTQRLSKRWRNILTLGVRKAYVEIKRATAAPNAGGVGGQLIGGEGTGVQTPEDRFVEAYGKSRYYHSTNPDNLPSIEKHGLLNYADRIDTLGGDVIGMSNKFRDSEFKGDEKKGVFVAARGKVEEDRQTLRGPFARAYLPRERAVERPEGEASSEELFHDRNFPGKAYITKASIGPELVTTNKMLDLVEQNDAKLSSILKAVATHYEADESEVPSLEEMKVLLREAIRTRRLSNAAIDNLEDL